ncbi:hypothetical protein DMN91_005071 [Ooceraea biroi]|uniref:Nucleolar protein 16 n=1 Tax=Ooceraea biroi TaxID=2015173 RepID=A0A026WBD2_OOCBI|nr:nucleolar protein 16 [Ooceraea biroi]EZA53253.1 Nucleolar protein [Ooceraea biroi]RLU22793.1 hypothetical protein DMN91_005071 [Ooceraea biroi]
MKIKSIRKLKRKKKYNANVNRKRLHNKLQKLPTIPCDQIKKAWDDIKSTRHNLKEMGLAYDANEAVQATNVKNEMCEQEGKKTILRNEDSSDQESEDVHAVPTKTYVLEAMEADAKAPRERLFRLPKGQAQFLTYLIKKYDEDYKAMSRDKKNQDQLTWKQIRGKIKLFKGIPEQYNEYLQNDDVQLE